MRIRDPQTGHRSRAGRSTRSRSGGTRAEVRAIPHLPSIQRQPPPPQTDYQTVSFATLVKKLATVVAEEAAQHPDKPVEVWATDEHRIGLKPILRRVWAPQGKRPIALGHHRYKWLYVTAFVQPTSGETRSEEHTSELQSHRDLHSFPTRRSSDPAPGLGSTRQAADCARPSPLQVVVRDRLRAADLRRDLLVHIERDLQAVLRRASGAVCPRGGSGARADHRARSRQRRLAHRTEPGRARGPPAGP